MGSGLGAYGQTVAVDTGMMGFKPAFRLLRGLLALRLWSLWGSIRTHILFGQIVVPIRETLIPSYHAQDLGG